MSREWKPGDVAHLKGNGIDTTAIRTAKGSWVWVDDRGSNPVNGTSLCAGDWGGTARPLVVIDPEDREQVERLTQFLQFQDFSPWNTYAVTQAQQALREFADPKPPKPDEPMGLGAVVEDAKGTLWVRLHNYQGDAWKPYDRRNPVYRRTWAGVAAVRVLSEGIDA